MRLDHRRDGAVEDVDEPGRVLPVGVTAHRRLVDGDLGAAGPHEGDQLALHDRQQRLGDGPPVGEVPAGDEPSAQRVRPRHAGLEHRTGRRQPAQPLELLDDAQPGGCVDRAGDEVAATLIVSGRAEAPRGRRLEVDAREEPVEREVEVEARLLAVGDDVETGGDLVVDGGHDGVVLQLAPIVGTELGEVGAGELQPAGQRVAPDDRGAQRVAVHRTSLRTVQPPSTVSVCPVTRRLSLLQR